MAKDYKPEDVEAEKELSHRNEFTINALIELLIKKKLINQYEVEQQLEEIHQRFEAETAEEEEKDDVVVE